MSDELTSTKFYVKGNPIINQVKMIIQIANGLEISEESKVIKEEHRIRLKKIIELAKELIAKGEKS